MKKENKLLLVSFRNLYKRILGFEEGTDFEATTEGIKKDITFRGHTAWILIFSILIASIGLNVNSTAVIIGAMLISPLMGPILGIGLSVGIGDSDTFVRSLKNLGIAVLISLFTSTLYFLITPLDIEQSEIIARTKPTLLDVLIALFGGFAGIIAGSRKEKSNVIPGVAIATALMPPLCTAGYGLANLKIDYFLGAFYLFLINSVFISLSTFLVVRYLKFPLVDYVSAEKLKRYKITLISFLVITITPSTVIFYHVIQESRFIVNAKNFVDEKCKFDGSELLNYKLTYSDTLAKIDLYFIGKKIDEEKKLFLEDRLLDIGLTKGKLFPVTKAIKINIYQQSGNDVNIEQKMSEFNKSMRIKIIEDIYTKNEEQIKTKDEKIKLLEDELFKLSKKDTIPFLQLSNEMKYQIPVFEKFAYSNAVEISSKNDTTYYDTIPLFLIKIKDGQSSSIKKNELKKAEEWLRVRMNNTSIKVLEY